ncbi:hypothetical protein HK405_002398, partial [Cladochytrium tenue]
LASSIDSLAASDPAAAETAALFGNATGNLRGLLRNAVLRRRRLRHVSLDGSAAPEMRSVADVVLAAFAESRRNGGRLPDPVAAAASGLPAISGSAVGSQTLAMTSRAPAPRSVGSSRISSRRGSAISIAFAENAETFITSLLLDPSAATAEPHGPAPYGSSAAFRRLQRAVRLVALASHFTKFLSRILKNSIQWGWEYDPDANARYLATNRRRLSTSSNASAAASPSAEKTKVAAVEFGVMGLFNTQKVFRGWLNDAMRSLFRKPPSDRTEADIMEMQTWCAGMKAFQKYQPHVQ